MGLAFATLAALVIAPSVGASAACEGYTYRFDSPKAIYMPTGNVSSFMRPGGTITFSETRTATTTAEMSASVTAEAGIIFAKASTTLGVSLSRSWSKSANWSYSIKNPSSTRYARLVMYHEGREFTVSKYRITPSSGGCNGRALVWRSAGIRVPRSANYNYWDVQYKEDGPGSTTVYAPLPTPTPPASAAVTPLYQYWNAAATDNFYTTQRDDAALAAMGWGYVGCPAQVFVNPEAGTTPLLRYWNGINADHFYTVDGGDYSGYGYVQEPYSTGYVFSYNSPAAGTVALYRYWNPTVGDHQYVTGRDDAVMAFFGYQFERIEAYVPPAPEGGCP